MAKRKSAEAPPSPEVAPDQPKADLRVESWPIDRPTPYPRNARVITDTAVDVVVRSLTKFGWRQPIVVDEAGVIVVGHTRLKAAQKLGLKTVPVHVMRGVPQVKIDAYRLMDNRSNQETMWDNDVLASELFDLKGSGYDLADTGFSAAELQTHLEGMETRTDVEAVSGGKPASEGRSEAGGDGEGGGEKPKGAITCPRCRKHFMPGAK